MFKSKTKKICLLPKIFLSLGLFFFGNNIFVGSVWAMNDVPIIISEAVPDGIDDIDRLDEPVTVGIPLPENSGISSVDQLGISGVNVGQFKVLKRYSNNNIWWVLVDTQVSVDADNTKTIFLAEGNGNFGGDDLAYDSGSEIIVDTGAAVFRIDKNNFNFFDSVTVGGEDIVSSGNNGEISFIVDGIKYTSKNSIPDIVIEDNGPVRSVVKIVGRLFSQDGNKLGGYILRIHFYKNKAYVRCDTEISNAYDDSTGPIYIDEAKITIPLMLSNQPVYEFGYNDNIVSSNLSDSAWVYQANYGQYGDRSPDVGLEIGNGAVILNELGNEGDFSQGWGVVDDSTKGLAVGIMQMKINEPAGLEFYSDGKVDISLISRHVTSPIVLQGGQHILNIAYLNFFDNKSDIVNTEHLTQYPLVARTTLEQYNSSGGIYGINIVSVDKERDFFIENGHDFPEENLENLLREGVNRNYTWATSGTPNSDWNLKYLIDFLRTGNGALYLSAVQGGIHNAVVATDRSDNFNFYENPVDFQQTSSLWGLGYDEEHTYWEGMAYLYLVTGNEFYRDSIIDFGEWLEDYIKKTGYRSYYTLSYSRNWSRSYRNMAILAWILDSEHYAENVRKMTNLLFKTPDNDIIHNVGVNFERGYINPAHGIDSDFMTSKLFPQSLEITSFCMGKDWESYEKIQDLISGLGFFVFGEFYGDIGFGCEDFGYPYNYDIDNTYTGIYRSKQSEIVLSNLFYNYGSIAFLDRAKKTMFGEIDCLWGDTVASELGVHTLMTAYDKYENESIGVDYIDPVGNGRIDINSSDVVYNGNGEYVLSWRVPVDGIVSYQIKFSEQPIVEDLNFDQVTRTYQYDPNVYDNFWAIFNIINEPLPVSKGDVQMVTINVEQVINAYNSRYDLNSSDSGYKQYDSNSDYYFAVKYFAEELPQSVVRSDVDQNSTTNSTDAMLTLRNSLGLNMSSTNWQSSTTTGDVNCDGVSNSTDAMLILRYSLGLDMSSTDWCIS